MPSIRRNHAHQGQLPPSVEAVVVVVVVAASTAHTTATANMARPDAGNMFNSHRSVPMFVITLGVQWITGNRTAQCGTARATLTRKKKPLKKRQATDSTITSRGTISPQFQHKTFPLEKTVEQLRISANKSFQSSQRTSLLVRNQGCFCPITMNSNGVSDRESGHTLVHPRSSAIGSVILPLTGRDTVSNIENEHRGTHGQCVAYPPRRTKEDCLTSRPEAKRVLLSPGAQTRANQPTSFEMKNRDQ